MKKIIIPLLFISIFQLGFSQKKELKTVDKQVKSADYENALTTLESINSFVETSDDTILESSDADETVELSSSMESYVSAIKKISPKK